MPDQDPTVLGMINQSLMRIERTQTETNKTLFAKLDSVCTTQTDLMITDEIIKAKISSVEVMNANTQNDIHLLRETLKKHADNPNTHYNPHYTETIPQKLWRKKPEIAAGGGLGLLIYTLIQIGVKYLGG